MTDLARLRELAMKATPGNRAWKSTLLVTDDAGETVLRAHPAWCTDDIDAQFIAACSRETILALLARIEAQDTISRRIQERIAKLTEEARESDLRAQLLVNRADQLQAELDDLHRVMREKNE